MNEYDYQVPLVVLVVFLFIGFTVAQGNATQVDPRPLGKNLPVYSPPENDQPNTATTSEPGKELSEEITLRQALSLALMHNPELAASTWVVRTT